MQFTKDITGFTGGVSQQPPPLRSDTQCEESQNAYPSLVYGNIKRPPLEHVAVLSSTAAPGAFMHDINRDINEKYNMIVTGNATEPLEVYTADGTKCTIRYGHLTDDFVFTSDASVKGYLTSLSGKLPREAFKAVTIADHTLLVNNTVKCLMSTEVDPTTYAHEAVAYIKKGVGQTVYRIWVNDIVAAQYTSGETTDYASYKTTTIAQTLAAALASGVSVTLTATGGVFTYLLGDRPPTGSEVVTINDVVVNPDFYSFVESLGLWMLVFDPAHISFAYASTDPEAPVPADTIKIQGTALTGFTVTVKDSLVKLKRADGGPFTFRVSDSWGDEAMTGIYRKIQDYPSLPSRYFNGSVIEVTGDPSNNFDNYWVKFNASEGGSAGAWEETRKPGLYNKMDPAALPHRLVRTGVNEFTFCDITWGERNVGDDVSCSNPSFIGHTINDIFYYRNRLGFFSGENHILSKAGDFFNFWPTTATDSLDDDPIDVAASSSEVVTLYHAVPYQKTLLGFGEQLQVVFSSGNAGTLTGKTISSDGTTRFKVSPFCKPALVGSNAYLAVPAGEYTHIREYFIQADGVSFDAADITAHCPEYLPKNIVRLIGTSTYDLLFAWSPDTPRTIFVYKYYWQGDEKVQSAWGKWDLPTDVIGMSLLDDRLYVLTTSDSQVCLQRVDLHKVTPAKWDSGLTPLICLDRRVSLTGTYSALTGLTSWTLPYTDTSGTQYVGVKSTSGHPVLLLSKVGSILSHPGDHSGVPFHIGLLYDHRLDLSKFILKDANNKPYLFGETILRTLAIGYAKTGYFDVEVSAVGRDTDTYQHSPFSAGCPLDQLIIGSGVYGDTLVMSDSDDVSISLVNRTCFPSIWVNATYEGTYYARARKI